MKNKNKQPIGVFDSGLGGLTVVKQLQRILPNEYLVYFGDTARIPYGTKSKWLIQRFAMEDALFLLDFNIKILVVACNTASSSALPVLQDRLDIPVVGVVEPGAHAAVAATRNKKIGVIGTSATIASGSYARSLKALMPQAEIFNQACPLLVSLVEEGWLDDEVTVLTLKKYLKPLMEARVDTIILGCTHYPLLEPVIQRIVGPEVTLIDSGKETAKAVQQILKDHQLLNPDSKKGEDQYFVSDSPEAFAKVGSLFLGKPLPGVKRVDFDRFLIEKSSSPFLQNLNEVIHAD
ncbi:glutamate racemase [candidate division KSB1 bacterium]|jgi:glutamate racemase|nr:MAG: glutamate racemase [candidate division KSB1 bacterium]